MSRPIEALDITLLRNNKNEFVISCQEIIAINIKRYIANGMFSAANFDDIKQSVTLELIKRIPLIEKNYNGEVLLITYVSVVIRNICLRIYDQEANVITPIPLGEIWMLSDENTNNSELIINELERFEIALKLFASKRFKILVCIKLHFSIPIGSTELRQCFRGITDEDLHSLLDGFGKPPSGKNELEKFNLLALMLNKYEETSQPEKSTMRWTYTMIQKLITLMNGNPPTRTHTSDSLRILLEHYSKLHTDND